MRETEAVREIHEIRERLYEEEKNLTIAEKIAKIKREAKEFSEKYGLQFRKYHPATH